MDGNQGRQLAALLKRHLALIKRMEHQRRNGYQRQTVQHIHVEVHRLDSVCGFR